MRAALLAAAAGLAGCNDVLGIPEPEREPAADAQPPVARCDHAAPFTAFSVEASLSTPANERTVWIGDNERTAIVGRDTDERYSDFYVATRDDVNSSFGPATALDAINSEDEEYRAALSTDGSTIYFDRQIGSAGSDPRHSLFTAVRAGDGWSFEEPVRLDALNGAREDFEPFPTDDTMYFASNRNGGIARLWQAPRTDEGFAQATAVPAGRDDVGGSAEMPVPSADGLALYFSALGRTGDNKTTDIWVAVRTDRARPFEIAAEIRSLKTGFRETPGGLSADNCRLYFTSDRGGKFDVWVAERTPM